MAQVSAPAVVVDTDVVSYLFKGDSRAEAYRSHLTDRLLVVSFMTVAELDRWALERDWGEARRKRMEQHLSNFVVHPFDRSVCLRWAEATDGARRRGRPIGVADAWIAATALQHVLPLVTNNASHYDGVENLTVISETAQQE